MYNILCLPYKKDTYVEINKYLKPQNKMPLTIDIFEYGIYLVFNDEYKVENFEEIFEFKRDDIGEILINMRSFNSPKPDLQFLKIGETGHVEKISRKYVRDVSTIFFEGSIIRSFV